MSRSYKKAIYKDKGIKSIYWRIVRSHTKNFIRTKRHSIEEEIIPLNKEVVNDYNYCDYIINLERKRSYRFLNSTPENLIGLNKKLKRK